MSFKLLLWLLFCASTVVLVIDATVWKSRRMKPEGMDENLSTFLDISRVTFLITLILLSVQYFNFAIVLVSLTLAMGLLWLLDVLVFARLRLAKLAQIEAVPGGASEQMRAEATREPWLTEMSRAFFPIILLVLVIRSFVVEPFRIPSGSMMPTLLIGDFILVNKFAYGLRLPGLNTKVIDIGEPKRGDVFVFRYPENPDVDYIKRVIGVPGDHIVYRNKQLTINGVPAKQTYTNTYIGMGSGSSSTGAHRMKENLLGVEHDVLLMPDRNIFAGDSEYVVPPGKYFAMGDNRDNSRDSRVWGLVPEENLVGKAFMIWMNWDWKMDHVIDWHRLGNSVK